MSKKFTFSGFNTKSKETEECIKAYRKVGELDAELFGDYDAYEAYDINKKKCLKIDESV